jgi:glycosyltransferase involved in cell wall biosynthesis
MNIKVLTKKPNITINGEEYSLDVTFTGGVSPSHSNRIKVLTGVSSSLLKEGVEFSLDFFLDSEPRLPAGICMHARGKLWGMDMYRILKKSRINLNVHIDLAAQEAANMRLFEATGVGGFLLTDYKNNIGDFFEPGKEIETFNSVDELVEKALYYLNHPDLRAQIAEAGQRKCFEKFTLRHSASQLDHVIRRAMNAKACIPRTRERLCNLFRRGLNPIP